MVDYRLNLLSRSGEVERSLEVWALCDREAKYLVQDFKAPGGFQLWRLDRLVHTRPATNGATFLPRARDRSGRTGRAEANEAVHASAAGA